MMSLTKRETRHPDAAEDAMGQAGRQTRGGSCREAGPRLQVSSKDLLPSPLFSRPFTENTLKAPNRGGDLCRFKPRTLISSTSNPAVVNQSVRARASPPLRVLSANGKPISVLSQNEGQHHSLSRKRSNSHRPVHGKVRSTQSVTSRPHTDARLITPGDKGRVQSRYKRRRGGKRKEKKTAPLR